MNNTQQDDITADLTDERLASAAADAFNKYLKTNPQIASNQACRAVAALAREGWRPIRSNALPAADGEVQQLAQQLHELAGILESLQIPHWPGRVLRAAELLGQQQAPAPVLASERPWKQEGWLHPQGLWCWQWRTDSVSWQMTTCGFSFAPSDDSLLLPYWAIIDPESSKAS